MEEKIHISELEQGQVYYLVTSLAEYQKIELLKVTFSEFQNSDLYSFTDYDEFLDSYQDKNEFKTKEKLLEKALEDGINIRFEIDRDDTIFNMTRLKMDKDGFILGFKDLEAAKKYHALKVFINFEKLTGIDFQTFIQYKDKAFDENPDYVLKNL